MEKELDINILRDYGVLYIKDLRYYLFINIGTHSELYD
jgi:hypothetical protein